MGDELFKDYAWTLALIAVACEPVGRTHLEGWGVRRSNLPDILADLADLLQTRREPWDAETLYTLGHDAIRQFLTGDAVWKPRLKGANNHLASLAERRLGKDWFAVDPFDPVQRYLLFHLLDHATELKLHERLLADRVLAESCTKHGIILEQNREFALSLLAFDLACRLLEDQVFRQGRIEFYPDFVQATMDRGRALVSLGRMEEALDDYGNSIRIFENTYEWFGCEGRELSDDLAIQLRYLRAAGYMNRGVALWKLGQPEKALDEYGLSIHLYEELAERYDLAKGYMNRGVALAELGCLHKAMDDYDACIRLLEELIQREGHSELRNDLAMAFMNRGLARADLGQFEKALGEYGASISLYEELLRREGRRELRMDLAMTYMNRGSALSQSGQRKKALDDFGQSISLYMELVQHEGRRELCPDLAKAYMNRGNALAYLGRLVDAQDEFSSSIDLYEELVKRQNRRDLHKDLAMAYMNRGTALACLGRFEKALDDYGGCVVLREELVMREGRHDIAGDLGWSYALKAKLLLHVQQREEACRLAWRAVSVLQSEATRTGRADLRDALELAEKVARNACD